MSVDSVIAAQITDGKHLTTLVDLLRHRAGTQPDQRAYTFLIDGEREAVQLTYAELDGYARAVAAHISTLAHPGERVILVYPPGLEFIIGFFACFYAGLIAVPVYPPQSGRLGRTLPRFQAIVANARPAAILSVRSLAESIQPGCADVADLAALPWVITEDIMGSATAWEPAPVSADAPAFLQYTSGSTADPKGVVVSHSNLWHNLEHIARCFGHTPESRGVVWLPPYHDMGLIGGILQPLYVGFPVVLMAPMAFLQKPIRWLQAIARYRATSSGGPNFAYDLCARKINLAEYPDLDLSSWQVAFNGAEVIRPTSLDLFAERFGPAGFRREAFYPCYGLAESTLIVTGGAPTEPAVTGSFSIGSLQSGAVQPAASAEDAQVLVGCGQSLPGQLVRIVNPERQTSCAERTIGEVWISGPCVAQGYWNNPGQTAATFQASLPELPGRTFLRTGDLGFLDAGELFITGRIKELIIIRGRNHYPQDIEHSVAQALPATGVATFSVTDADQEKLVVVAELERTALRSLDGAEAARAIRQVVAERHDLQTYGVVLIKPTTLPRTTSGKIQRTLCRTRFLEQTLDAVFIDIAGSQADIGASHDDPGPLQPRLLQALPEERLQVLVSHMQHEIAQVVQTSPERVGLHQALSSLGVDSLMAIQFKSRLEEELGVSISINDLMQGISVSQLAAKVLSLLEYQQQAEPLQRQLTLNEGDLYPLPPRHQALWFLQSLAPQSWAYNLVFAIRIRSALDRSALERTFARLAERHEALRATYPLVEGVPSFHVQPESSLAIEYRSFDGQPWETLLDQLASDARQPFDLAGQPAIRIHVYERAPTDGALLVTAHHIALDYWSWSVILDEFSQVYRAEAEDLYVPLADLPLRYTDYLIWQTQFLASGDGERMWRYWASQLAGPLPVLELPADRPRPPVQTFNGDSVLAAIDAATTARLKELARQHGVTLYTLLLAAYSLLLHRYSGQDDVLVGSPVAGRSNPQLMGLVGYFVNMVVVRSHFAPQQSLSGYLTQMRDTVAGALEHQEFPFATLVERLHGERDASRSPIFQATFELQRSIRANVQSLAAFYQGIDQESQDFGGLTIETLPLRQQEGQFDLTLSITEVGDSLAVAWQYNPDLFDQPTIARMAEHFATLCQQFILQTTTPLSQIPLLSGSERQRTIEEWNANAGDFDGRPFIQRFEEVAERSPDTVAAVAGAARLSYAELNTQANRLAAWLAGQGVGPDDRVALLADRGLEFLVAILAVFKAGAAYIPLDPQHPPARHEQVLTQARPRTILVTKPYAGTLKPVLNGVAGLPSVCCIEPLINAPTPAPNPILRAGMQNLAYIIFTSGSTGVPKGAMIEQLGMLNHLEAKIRELGLTSADRVAQNASQCFDISVWQFLAALLVGGTVDIYDDGLAHDPLRLLDHTLRQGVTILETVPALLRAMLAEMEQGALARPDFAALRWLVVTGEAFPSDLARRWLQLYPRIPLLNAYGPTECSDDVTHQRVDDPNLPERGYVPIGTPVFNMQVYVLDPQLEPAPIGVSGEVYVGGIGVGRGYLNDPARTAAAFIPDPFGGAGTRLYRTGDRGRYRPDGAIEFLERLDHQIKLRGFRIEIGEIETVLAQHPQVQANAVLVQDSSANAMLVAYVVAGQPTPTTADLRQYLGERLPEYMVPTHIVVLERLPLTANGKLDRKALPLPSIDRAALTSTFMPPESELERQIAAIWTAVLQIEAVGRNDSFFDLGGHSILLIQVHSRLRATLGKELSMVDMFKHPTVSSLARFLDSGASAEVALDKVQERAEHQRAGLKRQQALAKARRKDQ